MSRRTKSTLSPRLSLNSEKVSDGLKDLTSYIERHFDLSSGKVVLIGIQTRGFILAQRIHEALLKKGMLLAIGALDITLYRDDVRTSAIQPIVGETHLDFDLDDKTVVLVDDVLFTGRTVRAALDELMDYGRPRSIHLVVLIDRGHRELPITAEYAALKIDTKREETVSLRLQETDQAEDIVIGEAIV